MTGPIVAPLRGEKPTKTPVLPVFRNKSQYFQMLAAGQHSTLPTMPSFDMARVDVPVLSRHV